MTSTLIAPENEIFPNRKRWTRQQCERLVENGKIVGHLGYGHYETPDSHLPLAHAHRLRGCHHA